MTDRKISICLPKGDALQPLAELLETVRFPITEYKAENRTYRPVVTGLPFEVRAKIMAEKDVAIQVSSGNYDIGFCGLHWVSEHKVRYRAAKIHIFKHLGLNPRWFFACVAGDSAIQNIADLKEKDGFITLVSEYPNLAENFAIENRLKKFKIFSVWGSAEAYPPEHAEMAMVCVSGKDALGGMELKTIKGHSGDFLSDLCLVVNRNSFTEKNLSPVLDFFKGGNS